MLGEALEPCSSNTPVWAMGTDGTEVPRSGLKGSSQVLVPIEEYEALEETAEILSDDATLAAIRRGLDNLADDDVVTLR
ncbi:hypothetical protein BH23ACT9_BH23ACT9_30480 [soil metagenome]